MIGEVEGGNGYQRRLDEFGGRVARVAHELNAPVSLIVGSIENLERHLDTLIRFVRITERHLDEDPILAERFRENRVAYAVESAPRLMAVCEEGTRRLRHVLGQMRTYAPKVACDAERETIDPAEAIDDAVRMAAQNRADAPAVQRVHGRLPSILADREGLGQVLTNLLSNAFDAVADLDDPTVSVSAAAPVGSPTVEIRVRDNGSGVPSQNRHVIFEPFFSTKGRGAGLGLGLAIAREMIEGQGGSLTLDEGDGEGAEFVLRIPTAPT